MGYGLATTDFILLLLSQCFIFFPALFRKFLTAFSFISSWFSSSLTCSPRVSHAGFVSISGRLEWCHQSLGFSAAPQKPIIAQTNRMIRTKELLFFLLPFLRLWPLSSVRKINRFLIQEPERGGDFCSDCILGQIHVCMRSLFGGLYRRNQWLVFFQKKKRSLFSLCSTAARLKLAALLFPLSYQVFLPECQSSTHLGLKQNVLQTLCKLENDCTRCPRRTNFSF